MDLIRLGYETVDSAVSQGPSCGGPGTLRLFGEGESLFMAKTTGSYLFSCMRLKT